MEYSIDLPLESRDLAYFNSVKIELSLVSGFKSADDTKGGSFTASRRAEKRNEFSVSYVKINGVNNLFSVV